MRNSWGRHARLSAFSLGCSQDCQREMETAGRKGYYTGRKQESLEGFLCSELELKSVNDQFNTCHFNQHLRINSSWERGRLETAECPEKQPKVRRKKINKCWLWREKIMVYSQGASTALILFVRVSLGEAMDIAHQVKDVLLKDLIQICQTQGNPGMLLCASNPNDPMGRCPAEICGSL